ncbi:MULTISPECIES: hypothetical protein [unclassified Pseudovibrio]|uniref:hypothetical protein n=1 Tax=unclassified Pseudovibrio TaxID=2627060 RepID=UPI0007AEC148|nr:MULTISPECIES: hypothetical protein [unclassified Pseudovibrio]KZL03481.1 hypothetical protein PsW74_00556 [Pseudovibrio sp. W74]KZL10183.1 hypothetical protein PsAD14_01708 [Pseudovibrio sp. Ad14]
MPINTQSLTNVQSTHPLQSAAGAQNVQSANKAVEVGQSWKGSLNWQSGATPLEDNSHFRDHLTNQAALLQPTAHSCMNCKEAVLLMGLKAYADTPESNRVIRELEDNLNYDIGYNEILDEVVGYDNSEPATSFEAGDVVFFFADTHVALGAEDGKVLSLWFGPGDSSNLQEAGPEELFQLTKENPETYYQAAKGWFNVESGDYEIELQFLDVKSQLQDALEENGTLSDTQRYEFRDKIDGLLRQAGADPNNAWEFITVAKQPLEVLGT